MYVSVFLSNPQNEYHVKKGDHSGVFTFLSASFHFHVSVIVAFMLLTSML